jgi:SIR2-like domain
MQYFLLLGAGFSRNWGGWLASEVFEYLLGCPQIINNAHLRRALWKTKDEGGFEQALSLVQTDRSLGESEREQAIHAFDAALNRMFDDMNAALLEVDDLEFPTPQRNTVSGLLKRFDAIFTLNQDLLLEHLYMDGGFRGTQLPGLIGLPGVDGRIADTSVKGIWTDSGQTLIDKTLQPIYKLHGSTNWRTVAGGNLLVLGAAKTQVIESSRLLRSYKDIFEESLCRPDARLMVIGYGFGDAHINASLARGAQSGMRMFVIDPKGSDLARSLNRTRANRQIIASTPEEALFEECLIGASRRTLREIFGADVVEQNKLERFLAAR